MDNRGIFCDDGAYNFQIYGNIIVGLDNSYSIDSRRVGSVETSRMTQTGIIRSNINNVIRDNVVDRPIRFEGHENSDNGCYRGNNYILSENDDKQPQKSVYNNVNNDKEDVPLFYREINDGIIVISKADYKHLRGLKNWSQIKRYFKRK